MEKIKKEPGLPEGRDPEFDWNRFRTFARLDKKTDESLSRYFRSFVAMCRRVCHLRPGHGEGNYGYTWCQKSSSLSAYFLWELMLISWFKLHILTGETNIYAFLTNSGFCTVICEYLIESEYVELTVNLSHPAQIHHSSPRLWPPSLRNVLPVPFIVLASCVDSVSESCPTLPWRSV